MYIRSWRSIRVDGRCFTERITTGRLSDSPIKKNMQSLANRVPYPGPFQAAFMTFTRVVPYR